MTMRPAGSGRSTPAMILISVDLPDPFSPTRQCTSPAASERSTPRSATTPPKCLEIPWRSRKLAKARRSQTSVDQGPDRLLVDAHDLVDLDQLAGNVDRGLAQARYVDAVLDRLAVEHQPRDGDHRIAGVGRVPQEALADDAVRDQVLGLRRKHRADDRDLLA